MNEQYKDIAVENFKKWKTNNLDIAANLTEDVEMMAGVQSPNDLNQDDNWTLEWTEDEENCQYFIGQLSIDELEKANLGTSPIRNIENNNALSCDEAIKFLREHDIQEIIFIGLKDNSQEEISNYYAIGGALKINYYSEETAEELYDIIDDNNGSFRPDCCSVKGWTVFESEV